MVLGKQTGTIQVGLKVEQPAIDLEAEERAAQEAHKATQDALEVEERIRVAS